jgi:CIC family chloride channel protein
VLFALEVLLVDWDIFFYTFDYSCINGSFGFIILNEGILLNFIVTEKFNFWNLPFYVILGLLAGLMAVYHSRVFMRTERLVSSKIKSVSLRWFLTSVFLALLIAVFPPLFGEGYESLKILALKD